jgi:hypothetical protein
VTTPRRRTPDIRRAKPERRYYVRRDDVDERRQPPITTPLDPIVDVYRLIETMSSCGAGQGWTVSLADEADRDGLVVLRDQEGRAQMYMPREVYEAWLKT